MPGCASDRRVRIYRSVIGLNLAASYSGQRELIRVGSRSLRDLGFLFHLGVVVGSLGRGIVEVAALLEPAQVVTKAQVVDEIRMVGLGVGYHMKVHLNVEGQSR